MVLTGLDRLAKIKRGPWHKKRVGLICHQASVNRGLRHAIDIFKGRRDLFLKTLFAPEHGLAGTLQDQIPVRTQSQWGGYSFHSLYGRQRIPSRKMLQSLDCLFFDLQDVGTRYYTFIWTMALAMKACEKYGKTFIVLDRPNPLGGKITQGNIPDPTFSSFVGLLPLPVRHGMTVGELALFFKKKYFPLLDLHVIAMTGWSRSKRFDECGLPWVAPSPNMPTQETAEVYPGMCLIEGTNLSEGRGTTKPFELVGAPFIKGRLWAQALNRKKCPGVFFRPCSFQPTFHKWKKQVCQGVQIHITNRNQLDSFEMALVLIRECRKLVGKNFRWKKPPYEYEKKKLPFDILCGTDRIRKDLEQGKNPQIFSRAWAKNLQLFKKERTPFLLYP